MFSFSAHEPGMKLLKKQGCHTCLTWTFYQVQVDFIIRALVHGQVNAVEIQYHNILQ